jgi:hypothetical protein
MLVRRLGSYGASGSEGGGSSGAQIEWSTPFISREERSEGSLVEPGRRRREGCWCLVSDHTPGGTLVVLLGRTVLLIVA